MRQLLFADLTRRVLSTSTAGDTFTFPSLTAGDTLALSFRFLQRIGSSTPTETYPKIRAVRASIGFLDQRPARGSFALKVGSGSTSSLNTSAILPHNATAAQVKAALAPLATIAAGVEVTYEDGSYLIRCEDGRKLDLSVVHNALFPTSFGRVFAYEVNNEWMHELRLVQAPLAHTDSSQRVLPLAPFVTTIQDGYTSPDGLFAYPEIQQLTIPPDFRGSYQLKLEDYYRTDILDLADGPTEIQTALNKMLAQIGPDRSVSVTNPTTGQALITFGGEWYLGTDVEQLEAIVASAPPGDPTVELDLNSSEVWTALRSSPEIADVPLEIEFDVLDDTATGDDDLNAAFRTVKIQSSVRLKRAVFFPGLTGLQNVGWLREPSPKDYVPFTPSQVITGNQHYVSAFGNGTDNQYSFPHNLGTSALHVTVRENGGTNLLVSPDSYSARFASDNELVLTFAEPVPAASLAVTISTAGPVTAQNIHTHMIAQVVGLDSIIEDLGRRVADLELMLPRPGAASASAAAKPAAYRVPAFGEVLPDLNLIGGEQENITLSSQLVAEKKPTDPPQAPTGTTVASEEEKKQEEQAASKRDPDALASNVVYRAVIPAIGRAAQTGSAPKKDALGNVIEPEIPEVTADPALWPRKSSTRLPILLQAIQTSTITDTTVLPAPAAPTVYRNTGQDELILPGDFGRRDQSVPAQALFGFSKGSYYRVKSEGGNIYYPLEFERELWRLYIGPEQFPEDSTLEVTGELRMRLIGEFFDAVVKDLPQVDLAAQFILKCEAVEMQSGALMGSGINTVLLGQTKIAVSPALESMRWSLRIKNEDGVGASNWTTYGKSTAGEGFSTPAVLRLRLAAFDVDDTQTDDVPVRGQIAMIMPQTKLEVTV